MSKPRIKISSPICDAQTKQSCVSVMTIITRIRSPTLYIHARKNENDEETPKIIARDKGIPRRKLTNYQGEF